MVGAVMGRRAGKPRGETAPRPGDAARADAARDDATRGRTATGRGDARARRMRARRGGALGALLAVAALVAAAPGASADDPDPAVAFSARNVLLGAPFTVSGMLVNGVADAGRTVQLYERRAPFPGTWAVLQEVAAGPDGRYAFTVTPPRKAYFSVVTPATAAAPRQASAGYLVSVRRKVSIKVSDRTPRRNQLVRFSGFISPSYPLGPSSVATLQRQASNGSFVNVKAVLLAAAGTFSSYRARVHVKKNGTYRIFVPSSTYYSTGASVAIELKVHR